jgi:uncharacterized membrane protein
MLPRATEVARAAPCSAFAEGGDVMENQLLESLFRWIHVVAGILWIGLLYFFNFVNSGFAPTMDGDTKKKVVPELMPRALFWFRWGAAYTWVTGVLLLLLVYYHGGIALEAGQSWGAGSFLMLAIVFLGVFAYDQLYGSVLKDPKVGFVAGLLLASAVVYLMAWVGGFSYRSYAIHLGAMFGTFMAFNVWFRIWPSQQKIIRAAKEGQAPDPALVALAGTRSKHNTYMSVPLVFMMISQHAAGWATSPGRVSLVVLIGWGAVYALYKKAATVKGF